MKHYLYEEWLQYVNNEVDDSTREELENHLYTCDQCLENYLQAVTANETSLPTLSNESTFTDRVMELVPDTKSTLNTMQTVQLVPDTKLNRDTTSTRNSGQNRKKKPLYQQALFHYLLAAVATLLLTFTGAFQSLASYASSLESPHLQEKKPSMTEGVINKTFAWMDSLEKKEANKK
ncbi:anti-sigma factor family protein [Neobacillus jeddahensis]|uniref:anti-sigma factor family protein n=1 Tax=Neobacillus jeddahensis TaxID=1461580 RepID=UPI00058E6A90|nr:hypothetical protein [Neobacillus jeddahensis]